MNKKCLICKKPVFFFQGKVKSKTFIVHKKCHNKYHIVYEDNKK